MESQTTLANRHGFTKTFTAEYAIDKANLTIITPTSGKALQIKGVYIGTGSTDGKVRLYFATTADSAAIVYGADNTGYIPMFIEGAVDEPLAMTSTFGAGDPFFVLVNYTEN